MKNDLVIYHRENMFPASANEAGRHVAGFIGVGQEARTEGYSIFNNLRNE